MNRLFEPINVKDKNKNEFVRGKDISKHALHVTPGYQLPSGRKLTFKEEFSAENSSIEFSSKMSTENKVKESIPKSQIHTNLDQDKKMLAPKRILKKA